MSRFALACLALLALALAACEKPDASFTTSPSARVLAGTTTGNVAFGPPDAAPAPVTDPAGWRLTFDLAVFQKLENGTQAVRIVFEVKSQRGLGLELWLSNEAGTVARWSGGSSDTYDGVVCFQMALETETEAMLLPPGKYTATIAFRDVETGVVAAKSIKVTGRVPELDGAPPAAGSAVFRDLLGCPRGS